MGVYIYDGSLEGLLTAVYEAAGRADRPEDIASFDEFQDGLFVEKVDIAADRIKSDQAINMIVSRISIDALHNVFYVFLSGCPGRGRLIYDYIMLGLKYGKNVDRHLYEDTVHKIHLYCRKVMGERHRLLGLVRFQEVEGGIYYAEIEPDHDVVGLIAPHFAKRLSGVRWVIHDVKRGIAACYDTKNYIISPITIDSEPALTEAEERYQKLWRIFFKNIAITNRTNPKLQKGLMPERYWKHITEMAEERSFSANNANTRRRP